MKDRKEFIKNTAARILASAVNGGIIAGLAQEGMLQDKGFAKDAYDFAASLADIIDECEPDPEEVNVDVIKSVITEANEVKTDNAGKAQPEDKEAKNVKSKK